MVCVDVHDIPVVAVVDPDMTASMPKGLTAATGMDALTHAIEGYDHQGRMGDERYVPSQGNRNHLEVASRRS